jgi:hypothetical protein
MTEPIPNQLPAGNVNQRKSSYFIELSNRQWPPCLLRDPPVNTLQQHRQLRWAQAHFPVLRSRPDKTATLQPLGKQTRALRIPPDNFDQVAPTTSEHKQVARIRIFGQYLFSLRGNRTYNITARRMISGDVLK